MSTPAHAARAAALGAAALRVRDSQRRALQHAYARVPQIRLERDERDKRREALSLGLQHRMGIGGERTEACQVPFAEMARYIDPGLANQTTSDFSDILTDAVNKAVHRGYQQSPVSWDRFCDTVEAQSYQITPTVDLDALPSLQQILENEVITPTALTDQREQFEVEPHELLVSLTREIWVNDDAGALSDIAQRVGESANRTVDEAVYRFLEDNDPLLDGFPLFDTFIHQNLDVNSTSGPTDTSVRIAREEMGKYLGSGSNLNIAPHYMVVSPTYEHQAHELRATLADSDSTRARRGDETDPAIFEVIASNRIGWPTRVLGDWFLFGQKGKAVNVAFMGGQIPRLVLQGGWSHMSMSFRAIMDFRVYAQNYRYCRKIGVAD